MKPTASPSDLSDLSDLSASDPSADSLHVTLAPMDEQGIELFERALLSSAGTGEFQWFGFTSAAHLRARLAEDGFLSPGGGGGMLAILWDERHVGRVEWSARSWGRPATSSCWEIAIGIGAEHRGQGIGSTAQDLLARYLFEHTRAERVQASTDVENLAERRALIKAGFQEEGTVRRAQWRAGEWHDMVLYSRLRELG
ncbi:GNAT family N-acetyltransferase [Demequina lutea]|uniref:Aminoglycoside 6'-N-acetyltransferase n=1 Tax=Demequina lutea TaxID=431489 RepID=A0A7Y9Z8W8_9MICO|nr:GNAT family protein [Demequina lutea]NYI40989.1 aminoglycoside 6'-N-acetyltransferase [Demequina lutea]